VDKVASRAIIGIEREVKVSRAASKASGIRMRCFTTRLLSITEKAPEELLSQERWTNAKTVLDDWKNGCCDEAGTLLARDPAAELIRKNYIEIY
jgi:hypothetical protein